MTSTQLRDISVSVVEGFLNNKIPLSEGLAKQASAHDLNADQIQRGVEAVNTITYLKILGVSKDRTVEFPLCKTAEVMKLVSLPENLTNLVNTPSEETGAASQELFGMDGFETTASFEGLFQKKAGVDEDQTFTSGTRVDSEDKAKAQRELIGNFMKCAAENDADIVRLQDRSLIIASRMSDLSTKLCKDDQCLEKIAFVEDENYSGVCAMLIGKVETKPDFAKGLMFKEAQVKDFREAADLYKEARGLLLEIKEKQELSKKAAQMKVKLFKEASILSSVASGIGKGIGYLASKPFGMAGDAIKGGVGRSLHNTFGPATSKVTGKTFTAAKGITAGAAIGTAASVGLDASMYSPGKDQTTGASNDVWDALQRD